MKMVGLCETSDDFNSKEYKHYKPYQEPPKGYDWREYVELSSDGQSVITCHHCDIRRTGCQSSWHPRYYCKKDKGERQTTLGDF